MKRTLSKGSIVLLCIVFFTCLFLHVEANCLELKSPAFKDGETIPEKYTCKGDNISPSLEWTGVPAGTKSFALIMDDPDAPMGIWVHWVIYNIPGDVSMLKEDIPRDTSLTDGTKQGTNSFNWIGYGGPCPPKGPAHRYMFKLYALDEELDLPAGATKGVLLMRMDGHILDETRLTGLFQR